MHGQTGKSLTALVPCQLHFPNSLYTPAKDVHIRAPRAVRADLVRCIFLAKQERGNVTRQGGGEAACVEHIGMQ